MFFLSRFLSFSLPFVLLSSQRGHSRSNRAGRVRAVSDREVYKSRGSGRGSGQEAWNFLSGLIGSGQRNPTRPDPTRPAQTRSARFDGLVKNPGYIAYFAIFSPTALFDCFPILSRVLKIRYFIFFLDSFRVFLISLPRFSFSTSIDFDRFSILIRVYYV